MFGLLNGDQPGGVGIDTFRSVRGPGATCCPVTPMLSRYFDKGTGLSSSWWWWWSVELVAKIDW